MKFEDFLNSYLLKIISQEPIEDVLSKRCFCLNWRETHLLCLRFGGNFRLKIRTPIKKIRVTVQRQILKYCTKRTSRWTEFFCTL